MKQPSIFLLMALGIVLCLSCQKKETKYKEYTSPDKSYVVSIPEQIPANKCLADFMSFIKEDNSIIIQRIPVDKLNDDVTKINENSGKFSFTQIEVSDTSILYQSSKGLLTIYNYYLLKKLPIANYMICVCSLSESKSEIKKMGSRIYTSLKPLIPKDDEAKKQNALPKADKSYTTIYYSIKYPKEWKVLENINEMTDAYIGSQQEDFGLTIVRFETDHSLSKVHTETNESIRQAGFRILSDKQITMAGRKCYETLQEGTLQGKRFKHLSYIFKKGDMLYSIKFGNLSNDKRKALADEIIASFRIK